jgi:hypothetical protein
LIMQPINEDNLVVLSGNTRNITTPPDGAP